MRIRTIIFIGFSFFLPILVCGSQPLVQAKISGGDLVVQKINNDWNFYWERIIEPAELSREPDRSDFIKVNIPSYWTSYQIGSKRLPGTGFATYTKSMVLPQDYDRAIGIFIPTIDVAYRFYINGQLVSEAGVVSRNREEEVAGYRPALVRFQPECDTLQLVVQVSNFHHRRGGIWKVAILGPYHKMERQYFQIQTIDFITTGILLSFGIFFLIFSFFNPQERSLRYFSVSFLFIFLRAITTNQFPLDNLFNISWETIIATEYTSSFCAIVAWLWAQYYIKPFAWFRKAVMGLSALLIPILLIIFLCKVHQYTFLIFVFYAYLLSAATLFFLQILIRSKSGHKVPGLFLVGILLVLLAIINDTFVSGSFGSFSDFYIVPQMFIVFLIILSVAFFQRFQNIYRKEQRLGQDLALLNAELEKKVEQRTLQLKDKSEIIEEQNRLLQKELFLKNRVLTIIGHDLHSPLSTIVMLLDLISEEQMNESEKRPLIQRIRLTANSILLLVVNLLSWGLNQNKQLKLNAEYKNLSELIPKVIDQVEPFTLNKEITITSQVPPDLMGWFDENMVMIVLRNLLSNATKFTPRGGTISILAKSADGFLVVEVADTGIGIAPDQLEQISASGTIISTRGTELEKGTGLGISLCKELLALNSGQFSVKSEPGKGSCFSFALPITQPVIRPSE